MNKRDAGKKEEGKKWKVSFRALFPRKKRHERREGEMKAFCANVIFVPVEKGEREKHEKT